MILKLLYDLALGAPAALTRQILEGIRSEADRERLVTEESILERLRQLQAVLEAGDMAEEEYEDLEEKLIERLRLIRQGEKGT